MVSCSKRGGIDQFMSVPPPSCEAGVGSDDFLWSWRFHHGPAIILPKKDSKPVEVLFHVGYPDLIEMVGLTKGGEDPGHE